MITAKIHLQATKQLKLLRRMEREGQPLVRRYATDLRAAARSAFRGGNRVQLSPAKRAKITDELADLMTNGYARRYRLEKQHTGVKPGALKLSFADDVENIADQFDLDLDGIADSFTTMAGPRVDSAISGIEDRINSALASITAQQQPAAIAARQLERRLDEMGITPRNAGLAETLVRTHAMMAFGAAQYHLDQDDPYDTIWGYVYVTVGDDRVRPEHAALEGLTRTKDDPIWSSLWPPNGWNCRCQLVSLTKPALTTQVPSKINIDDAFNFNPGQMLAA